MVSGAEWDVGHAPVEILNKSLHKKIISTSKLNILYSRKQLKEIFDWDDNHNSVNHRNRKDVKDIKTQGKTRTEGQNWIF